jgi:hypothetical protein
VPDGSKKEIRASISQINEIVEQIRQIRYAAASDFDDSKPKPKTKKEQEERDRQGDSFKKDYGQNDVFKAIHELANVDRWRQVLSRTDSK